MNFGHHRSPPELSQTRGDEPGPFVNQPGVFFDPGPSFPGRFPIQSLWISSGWWFEPLWKIWKSIGMIIPNIWENKKWQPNHQPDYEFHGLMSNPHETSPFFHGAFPLETSPAPRYQTHRAVLTPETAGRIYMEWCFTNMLCPRTQYSAIIYVNTILTNERLCHFLLDLLVIVGRCKPRNSVAWGDEWQGFYKRRARLIPTKLAIGPGTWIECQSLYHICLFHLSTTILERPKHPIKIGGRCSDRIRCRSILPCSMRRAEKASLASFYALAPRILDTFYIYIYYIYTHIYIYTYIISLYIIPQRFLMLYTYQQLYKDPLISCPLNQTLVDLPWMISRKSQARRSWFCDVKNTTSIGTNGSRFQKEQHKHRKCDMRFMICYDYRIYIVLIRSIYIYTYDYAHCISIWVSPISFRHPPYFSTGHAPASPAWTPSGCTRELGDGWIQHEWWVCWLCWASSESPRTGPVIFVAINLASVPFLDPWNLPRVPHPGAGVGGNMPGKYASSDDDPWLSP